MKGEPKVNARLNGVLKLLLTGINQYFLHSRMCGNWGMDDLKKKDYDYSIYLMKAADKVINRILFLEGLPNLQDLGKLYLGEDVPQILAGNLKFEMELRASLVEAVAFCESQSDFVSREACESILHECEEQIDWLEAQQYLIDHAGLQNYLQSAV
ncbi:MAG: bacterioferritin [Kangiellaceae bacterium]|nr:bacterioferritin [Kangiellaceae bacterium]MCW9000391.1 bacterioferritin [Kangiellaceae bacterium]MCW9018498.1 bacterioferritin [Kangiellaceae bacterium]